jgi:alpha-tubulin suppressor-like RCC1 family protein
MPSRDPSQRHRLALGAFLVLTLGCHEGAESPTEPAAEPSFAGVATGFFQISAGSGAHTCAVTATGTAFCWGANFLGQLGDGGTVERLTPVPVAGGLKFRMVSAGNGHSCGVTTDNRAYCWGNNQFGRLGVGTTFDQLTPVPVVGGLQFRHVSVGIGHTCGLTTTNRIFCWGRNDQGQLGDGSRIDRLRPVAIAGGRQYRQVSAGGIHTCAVTTSYQAFCWGFNDRGRLGIGSTVVRRLRPAAVAGTLLFSQISASYTHTCAVTTGARAFCWGFGLYGQVGDGQTLDHRTPRAVAGGIDFTRVTAGPFHTCGEAANNRAYCWGLNETGAIGDGTNDNSRTAPVLVAGSLSFRQLSSGNSFTCGKTSASAVYCWGFNQFGQLGDGTTTDRVTPTPVAGGS